MGMSVAYQGSYRYFSEPILLHALANAEAKHEVAVQEEGGCYLTMEQIKRDGLTLRIDSSGFCPASATWGGDSMLRALAREALEGEVKVEIDEETTYFKAIGGMSAVRQDTWSPERAERLEQARHMLGRQILAAVDRKVQQLVKAGIPKNTEPLLRKTAQMTIAAVMEILELHDNHADERLEPYVHYRVHAAIKTGDGDLVEEIDLTDPEGEGLYVLSEDQWLRGRLG